jgi:hypothetical protein
MKCISLAKNLTPELIVEADDLSRGSAKHFLEAHAKEFEAKEARSRETQRRYGGQGTDEELVRKNVGDRRVTIGSEDYIYTNNADCGLFNSVLTAYNKHWKLRISPEDWWFVVARRVAIAIDKNSKKEAVRKMFVEHEGKCRCYSQGRHQRGMGWGWKGGVTKGSGKQRGEPWESLIDFRCKFVPFSLSDKKTLQVDVPVANIYDVDYTWFFDEMSKEISKNVKVPSYVDVISADFSSTTPVQRIVSQITLMSSLQEFFEYK